MTRITYTWSCLRVRLLASLLVMFFVGGTVGALGFKHVGFLFTLPLATILVVLAVMPILDDMRRSIADPA